MRTIALEEHYATAGFLRGPGSWLKSRAGVIEPISDLGAGRIAAMDDAGIDLAVLSLAAPGVEQLDGPKAVPLARECNDELAEAVERYPDRLAGFATVPISSPDAAADELERAVREHGFLGAVINGHCQGRYLDDPDFEPVLDRAAALNVPIYLHPTIPPAAVIAVQLRGVFRRGHLRAGHGGLGLAHQHGHARAAHDSRRRVRPPPEAADHHRAHGRSDVVHAAAIRRHPEAGTDRPSAPGQYLPSAERALHVRQLQRRQRRTRTWSRRSALAGWPFRPTTRSARCGPHVRFSTICRSPTTIGRASATATPRNCWACDCAAG